MSIEEKLKQLLVENCLFESQAESVLACVKLEDDTTTQIMGNRWRDDADAYPPQMLAVLWVTTKRHALEWIDANKPKHWARDMFVDGGDK